jgi:hypothetical protein
LYQFLLPALPSSSSSSSTSSSSTKTKQPAASSDLTNLFKGEDDLTISEYILILGNLGLLRDYPENEVNLKKAKISDAISQWKIPLLSVNTALTAFAEYHLRKV